MAFTCDRPSRDVLGYYREQCDRSDGILAGVSLSDAPRGSHGGDEIPNVRTVVLRWRRTPAHPVCPASIASGSRAAQLRDRPVLAALRM
jgi:hypothetical protein